MPSVCVFAPDLVQHRCGVRRVRRHHDRLWSHAALRSATRQPCGRAATRKHGPVEGDAPPARRTGRGADGVLLRCSWSRPPSFSSGFRTALADDRRPSTRPAGSRDGGSAFRLRSSRSRPPLLPAIWSRSALSVPGISATAWVGTLPGMRPAWTPMRVELPQLPLRDVTMDVVPFTRELARARHDAADRGSNVRRTRHGPDVPGGRRQ